MKNKSSNKPPKKPSKELIIAVLRDSQGKYIAKVELIGWNDAPENLELMALNYTLEDSDPTIGHYIHDGNGKK